MEENREDKWKTEVFTYPVLHASLNILTESAVTTNASPHARCPRCGFGPEKISRVNALA
jgi:hypothetical protein